MSDTNVKVPVEVLKKIASFVTRVPEAVAELTTKNETPVADNSKQASECVTGLIKYAGLEEEKRSAFEQFVATPEGAMKTINSLTNKVAALNEELESAKQLSLGAPSKRASFNNSVSDSSRVWCETLLG